MWYANYTVMHRKNKMICYKWNTQKDCIGQEQWYVISEIHRKDCIGQELMVALIGNLHLNALKT